MNEAQRAPWLDEISVILAELSGLDDVSRRRRTHQAIRDAAGWTAERRQGLRDALVGIKAIGPRDFATAMKEAREQAERQRREEAATVDADALYTTQDGWLCLDDPADGPVRLAAFVPRVVADVVRDDGAEQTRLIRIEVTPAAGRPGTVEVSPERLAKGREWAAQAVGAAAVILPRRYAIEHVVTAAQLLSDARTTETIYGHTGWRRLDGQWRYLSAGGALGADGLDPSTRVDLGERLGGYALLDPGDDRAVLRDAVRAVLDLVKVAPARVMVPMLGAALRAPLPALPESAVYVVGASGSLKSAVSAVVQQTFGAGLDARHLPGNWASTANSIETTGFMLANALMVIDDYAPQAHDDPRKLAGVADRVLRGSANAAGRDRLRPDGTPRPAKPPRAQILTTGEDIPPGHSLRARLTIVEIEREDVDLARLTAAQKLGADGVLTLAMSGYVRWLAARRDGGDLVAEVRQTIADTRARLASDGGRHLRTPDAAAGLLTGWASWLRYAVEIGAIDQRDHDRYAAAADRVMAEVSAGQAEHTRESSPTDLWLAGLRAALTGGGCHLADAASGDGPPTSGQPAHWGWSRADRNEPAYRGNGTRIGWVSRDGDVWLDGPTAYEVARRHACRAGDQLGVSRATLGRRLAERGWITRDGRNLAVSRDIAGRRKRVTALRPGLLDDAESDG